ncbi:uncharacterized protein [Phaseolus vulgaris]|uniref:uncharacterized protein n=1 Tax=Phaseolus vulgaris TaxID=3885 RepID=UPI0035C9EEA8
MKLPDLSRKVIVIKSDQQEAKRCYENSLKTKRGVFMVVERPHMEEAPMEEDCVGMRRAENARERRPEPAENVVERQIGGKTFKLAESLDQEEQNQVAEVISRHLDAFAWSASDMLGIDPNFLCHCLTMDPKVRPVRQRRRKFNEERRLVIQEEMRKLLSAGHIREIQYPKWLANVVLNAGATYQRLMDKVLAPMSGRNMQAYVDDMVVTSQERGQQIVHLEDLFATIAKYRLRLNPEKCVFGVEAGKFLGFLLTERGIEANLDKCVAILAMRSLASVKEVQQLTGQMAALSRFVSVGGDKGHPYFQCLTRNS